MLLPIHYNAPRFRALMVNEGYEALPEPLRQLPGFERRAREWLEVVEFFEPASLFDRSGVWEPLIPHKNLNPMPKPADFAGFQMSFAEICDAKAAELVASGKQLELYWSGGMDSTVIMVALLKAGVRREQLHLYLTWNSVAEYRNFYRDHVSGFPHTLGVQGDVKNNLTLAADKLVVTGEVGDQLFGSGVISRYTTHKIFQPYQDVIPERIQEILAPAYAQAPVTVKTANEYLWYANFCFKYQAAATRFLTRTPEVDGDFRDYLVHFFDDLRFEHWSLANQESKIGASQASYKTPAREYIYAFTQDEAYYKNKIKVNSLRNIQLMSWRLVLENGRTIMDDELGPYLQQLTADQAGDPS